MLEVEDESNLKSSGSEIIEHPTDFMIGDSINGFGVNDNLSENNEIRNVFPDFYVTVMKWKSALLLKRNSLIPEFNGKRFLIGFFMKSMTQSIVNGKRATDNDLGLFDMNPISSICVHPVHLWLNFFMRAKARRVAGGGR
jgi:hypothetical protein